VGEEISFKSLKKTISDVLTGELVMLYPEKDDRVVIRSPVHGCISVSREMAISILDGVNGTAGPGDFVILGLKRFSPFLVLVSEKKPHISYPIINPATIVPDYRPEIPREELENLGNPGAHSLQVVNVVQLDGRRKVALLDLRHPIFINVKKRMGKQVQVEKYPEKFEIPIALLRQ
jgi:flagellar assembly factor FliW